MKTFTRSTLLAALTLGLAAGAQAQTYSPKVPDPTNPFPANPIATDGTPLPSQADRGLYTGRSAAVGGPLGLVGGLATTGVDTAGAIAGTGLGVAGSAVDAGFGTAGDVLR